MMNVFAKSKDKTRCLSSAYLFIKSAKGSAIKIVILLLLLFPVLSHA